MKTFSMKPSPTERLETVACVVCGANDRRPYWQCDGFGFVQCRNCGHVYQSPRPRFDDLRDRYADEYFDYELENDRNFLNLMLQGLEDIHLEDLAEHISDNPRFLDIGCATGMLLEHLQGRGYRVQGVEVCEPAARYGRETRGVPIAVGTIDELDLPRASYDFAHFSHVIEHVPDPRAFLERVHELLAPGGYVVIVTPNRAGFQAKIFGAQWRSAIADHLNLFSAAHLMRLMREVGFSVERSKTWGGLAAGAAPRWLKRPADRLAKRFGFGDVVLVLGRKAAA